MAPSPANDGPPAAEAPTAAEGGDGVGVSAMVAAAAAASALEGASALTCTVIDDGAPPAKRARTDGGADELAAEEDADVSMEDGASQGIAEDDVRAAILAYKRHHGTTYDVVFPDGVSADSGNNQGDSPFGIRLASVRVRSAHALLPYYFEKATKNKWRGRPPAPSDQAIVVEKMMAGAPEISEGVQRNDVLLFIDDKLVNITDKKRLKYYRSKVQNGKRPMKLTFFRPGEGEDFEEDEDEEPVELANGEAVYITGYEAPEKPVKPKSAGFSVDERKSRRAVLERRLEELEVLQMETSAELGELRARDGIVDEDDEGERPSIKVKGNEDFVIPSHIAYHPPTKLRRKKMKPLNEACNAVENLLRQRMSIDNEADKIRESMKRSQMRLEAKESELKELDSHMGPALDAVKELEATVQDHWKGSYDKLKEYYDKNGHCNVMEKEDAKLAKWVTRQRTCYANAQSDAPTNNVGTTKPYQVYLLNQIDFCWNPREQQFIQNVHMLKEYRKEHGDANVPMKHSNIGLANFVQKWRREYRLFTEGKPCNMTQERLQILEEAGFSWRDPSRGRPRKDTRKESWDDFIAQLQEFKAKYGHFMVNRQNKLLEKGDRLYRLDEFCGWVRKQYVLYKAGQPSQLTNEKVNQLKELGFWLERGEAQRYTKAFSPKKGAVAQLGQLHVPKVDGGASGGAPWHADESEGKAAESESVDV